ncbi:hypothetical protein MIR68_010974 [Amoeboaphelidium protococcarum]|nr:hypothetical protein MIR68_010974 [Amoeboaphelidium protococcarum]
MLHNNSGAGVVGIHSYSANMTVDQQQIQVVTQVSSECVKQLVSNFCTGRISNCLLLNSEPSSFLQQFGESIYLYLSSDIESSDVQLSYALFGFSDTKTVNLINDKVMDGDVVSHHSQGLLYKAASTDEVAQAFKSLTAGISLPCFCISVKLCRNNPETVNKMQDCIESGKDVYSVKCNDSAGILNILVVQEFNLYSSQMTSQLPLVASDFLHNLRHLLWRDNSIETPCSLQSLVLSRLLSSMFGIQGISVIQNSISDVHPADMQLWQEFLCTLQQKPCFNLMNEIDYKTLVLNVLEKSHSKLRKESLVKDEQLDEAGRQIAELKVQLASQQQEQSQLEQSLSLLNEEKQELMLLIKELQSQYEAASGLHQKSIGDLNTQLQQSKSELATLNEVVIDLSTKLKNVLEERKAMESMLMESDQTSRRLLAEAESSKALRNEKNLLIEELSGKVESLKLDLGNVLADNGRLLSVQTQLQQELDESRQILQRVSTDKSETKELENDLRLLRHKVASLESEKREMMYDIKSFKVKLQQLESLNQGLNEQLEQSQKRLEIELQNVQSATNEKEMTMKMLENLQKTCDRLAEVAAKPPVAIQVPREIVPAAVSKPVDHGDSRNDKPKSVSVATEMSFQASSFKESVKSSESDVLNYKVSSVKSSSKIVKESKAKVVVAEPVDEDSTSMSIESNVNDSDDGEQIAPITKRKSIVPQDTATSKVVRDDINDLPSASLLNSLSAKVGPVESKVGPVESKVGPVESKVGPVESKVVSVVPVVEEKVSQQKVSRAASGLESSPEIMPQKKVRPKLSITDPQPIVKRKDKSDQTSAKQFTVEADDVAAGSSSAKEDADIKTPVIVKKQNKGRRKTIKFQPSDDDDVNSGPAKYSAVEDSSSTSGAKKSVKKADKAKSARRSNERASEVKSTKSKSAPKSTKSSRKSSIDLILEKDNDDETPAKVNIAKSLKQKQSVQPPDVVQSEPSMDEDNIQAHMQMSLLGSEVGGESKRESIWAKEEDNDAALPQQAEKPKKKAPVKKSKKSVSFKDKENRPRLSDIPEEESGDLSKTEITVSKSATSASTSSQKKMSGKKQKMAMQDPDSSMEFPERFKKRKLSTVSDTSSAANQSSSSSSTQMLPQKSSVINPDALKMIKTSFKLPKLLSKK